MLWVQVMRVTLVLPLPQPQFLQPGTHLKLTLAHLRCLYILLVTLKSHYFHLFNWKVWIVITRRPL
jgi:hypothetical protein